MQRYLFGRLLAVAVIGLLGISVAAAIDPVNQTRQHVAIEGYDPVAYFDAGKPVAGLDSLGHSWQGATWLFSTAERRDRFVANPEKYAPQYGGYCAKAVSDGDVADIDPQAWSIVDGKLYLNYSLKIRKVWEADRDARIARADRNWPELLRGSN